MNAHQGRPRIISAGNGWFLSARQQLEVSVDQPDRRTRFPNRKISETFLHFAEPLLDPLGPRATIDQMEQALKLAFTVWNGVVYDEVNGNTHYLDLMRNQARHDRDIAALVDRLIARKCKLFGDDIRLVGEFKLTRTGGEIRLRAEARDPTQTRSTTT